MCDAFGAFFKKRVAFSSFLPPSRPALFPLLFLPPCLLSFVRVGSVRLARIGFDVWLPFSVGRGIFKGLPYDCGPEMFCSQCRSPAPQAPARREGAPSVIRLLATVAHQATLIQAKPLQPVDIIIADSAPRRRARRGHLPRPATAAMGKAAKGAGGGGSAAAPLFAQRLDALQAQVNAQQAKLDETHRLVSNNGEGLKAEHEEMKRYFDETRDVVDDVLAKTRAEFDRKVRKMDDVIDRNGAQFKENAAKYRERAEEAFAEARRAQENQARETAKFKQTVQDLATLDKHVTTCFTTAMKRNDEFRAELQDAARDYANVHNDLETLREQVAHLQKGLREKDAMSRRNLKAKVIELSGEFESMRGEVHTFAYNMAGDGIEGQESGGVEDDIERGQRAATLLRARAESAPPASGRHHLYVAEAAEKSGATGFRPYIQSVQASADQVLAVAPPMFAPPVFAPPVLPVAPSTPPAVFVLQLAAPDLSGATDCKRLEVGGCDFCMGGMGVGGEGRVGAIRGEGRSAATYCRQDG